MKCTHCEKEVEEFFSEEIECCSCGDTIIINYYHCDECKTIWKAQNDEIIFSVGLNTSPFPDEMFDVFERIEEELEKKNQIL